jgi:hypothetical protein
MATATQSRPNPAAARDATVERAISAAANKLRTNDVVVGATAAAVLVLGYLTLVVLLDKLLNLPDWVRLIGLLGLLGGLVAVVYYLIVRPMQRRVNPRYVARKIEETLPDAKNVLINWVDLQDKELPGSVKAAVGANAAAGVADADVESATGSKPIAWLGGAAGGLVVVLAVLFLVFSGPQFLSLLKRAVVPFKPAEIATATTITVDEPQGGDVTITDGQPLTVAVSLGGRVPNPDGPDKPRLLIRYGADSTEVTELPLTQAGTSRDYRTDLGRGTILNGFWYRVVAGDGTTPEYRVTVRTRPMLGEFVATYEYPAYLKWPTDTEKGAKLRAIRGTSVTLSAKANRELQSATLTAVTTDGAREIVRGVMNGDRVTFTLKLQESGTYRIDFKPTGPELSTASADYPIEVELDRKPVVQITSPKEPEVQLPLNGLLAVDGTATDDHGIAAMELRFKLVGNDSVAIKPKAFRDGKPLTREQDGTQLTNIPDYKDSVKLDTLTTADGQPLVLKDADVLEYWIAAIDNCTEPTANVGESVHQKVRLTPAVKEPEKKQDQVKKEQQRKNDEKNTEAKRDERLKNEKRPEEQNRNPNKDPQQQPKEENPDGSKPNQDPMQGEKNPEGSKPENPPDGGQEGNTKPEDKDLQEKADKTRREIEKKKEEQKQEGGDARGDGDKSEGSESKPEANTKPPEGKPGSDGAKGSAGEKAGPKPEDMTKPNDQPSEGKDGGKLVDPERSEGKKPPKPDAKGEDQPTGDKPKDAPKEGTEAGTSKESKESPQPKTGDPKQPQDGKKDGQAGDARGAEPPQGDKPPQDPTDPMQGGNEKPQGGDQKKVDPKDLSGSKPKGEPTRGDTKPEPKGGQKGEPEKDAGDAKGEAPPKPAESKDPSKGGQNEPMPKKGPPADAGQEKQPPKEGTEGKEGAAEPKGEGVKPMTGGKEDGEKGTVKPSDVKKPEGSGKPDDKNPMGNGKPDDKNPMGSGSGEKQPDQKDPMKNGGSGKPEDKKLDPKEMKEAVENLDSKDPNAKKDAQEKLDKAVGKENREKIEQMQKDLKGDDKAKREAAQKELEKMTKDAEKNAGGQKPKQLTEQEKKELLDAAKNLDSKDEKTKKDAQDKLDKAMGKENREKIEQMQKDLKGDDKAKREAAEKQLQEIAKNAQKGDQPDTAKKPEMSEQQKQELADAAAKLNSKDEQERKAAEQKLDDAIGKDKRQELQQDLKDLQGNDPTKAEQAKTKLEKQLEDAKNGQNQNTGKQDDNKTGPLGGGNNKTPGKPLEANLENQLKSRELALDDFKKYQGDKQFLKENKWTEEEYDRFLRQEEAAVKKLREQVDNARVNPPAPGGRPTVGRNGFDQLETRGTADKTSGPGGPPVAPPGFEGAVKRFNGEASKQK